MKKILFLMICSLLWLVCCSNSESPENPGSDSIEISEIVDSIPETIDSIPEVEDSVSEIKEMEGMLHL